MRDVQWGWLLRYIHSTGASMFFVVVYLHMFRGLMYGSYRAPRELIWIIGMVIYLMLMGEAFMGYLLPWGQMSSGCPGDREPVLLGSVRRAGSLHPDPRRLRRVGHHAEPLLRAARRPRSR